MKTSWRSRYRVGYSIRALHESDLGEVMMTDQERRGWIIVGAICVTMFFIWGAINSGAVFFVPVLKYFGWTRAKFSTALSAGWVTGGLTGPLIGWLADRVNPKRMMMVGATIVGLLWLLLSRATSFGEFLLANGLFGICVGASTTIPCSLIIASWFERQRGLAIGIAFAAAPIGGAVMTPIANHVISIGGWRAGYVVLGLPILLVVVPLIFFFVRPRNSAEKTGVSGPASAETHVAAAAIEVPGFELGQAAKTRSFWLICGVQLLIGSTLGMGPHYVAYLTGVGYSAGFAASVVSMYLLMTTLGALLGGPFADRVSARGAMIATCVLGAFGAIGLMGASHSLGLAANIIAGGFALGALGVQMPLVIIESLGVKRLGSLLGVTGVCYTAGAAASPIVTGRIFDVTGSYEIAVGAIIALMILSAITLIGCRPLAGEEAQFATPAPSAAA
ncbi:MAG: MFS transporter [Candidatus Binataceae bacterium]